MERAGSSWWVLCGCALLTCCIAASADHVQTSAPVSFRRDVAPILLSQCQSCHGPKKSKSGYRVDTFDRLMKPGKSKDAPIVAGQPDDSALFRLITSHDEDERMPQKADALPPQQVLVIG